MFSDLSTPPKEPFAPVLFHRVKELLLQSREKFVSAANAGKGPLASLPFKKHPLAASSDPEFGRAAVPNPLLSRIVGLLPTSCSAGVQFDELARLESVARQTLQAQSVSFWIFNALLNWLVQESFVPSDSVLFEELVQAFSLAMVLRPWLRFARPSVGRPCYPIFLRTLALTSVPSLRRRPLMGRFFLMMKFCRRY